MTGRLFYKCAKCGTVKPMPASGNYCVKCDDVTTSYVVFEDEYRKQPKDVKEKVIFT